METIKQLEIKKSDDGLFVDVLKTGYNIIDNTIYDERIAKKILQVIDEGLPEIKMVMKVYNKKKELVYEKTSVDAQEIYEELAQVLFAKIKKTAKSTSIKSDMGRITHIIQRWNDTIYYYDFNGVML